MDAYDKMVAARKRYYEKNRERLIKYAKDYYKKRREEEKENENKSGQKVQEM